MGNSNQSSRSRWRRIFFIENIGFVHKRLAILDPTEKGQQPMHSKDGKWVVVFNGCIYNFKELREELIEKGSHISIRNGYRSNCRRALCLWNFVF